METLKVIYIDDDIKDVRRVQFALDQYFSIEAIKPTASIDELLEELFALNPDAAIVDFRLSELESNIHYDGSNVIDLILQHRANFPVFLLTSHQDDAFVEVEDVNIVYEKGQVYNGSNFPQRVILQIQKYQARLQASESRLLDLLDFQRQRLLTLEEEEELISLDDFIEKSLRKQGAVPETLKESTNQQKISELLHEVDILLNKVNQSLPDHE